MLVPVRGLGLLIILLTVVAPIARYVSQSHGNIFGMYALWANCDALVIGAALCLWERAGRDMPVFAKSVAIVLAVFVVACTAAFRPDPLFGAVVSSAVPLTAAYVIWRAKNGFILISSVTP